MIEQMIGVLAGCAERSESVPLHHLLWTVDSRHHAIPTASEINQALEAVPVFQIVRAEDAVVLVPGSDTNTSIVTDDDIVKAMKSYEQET